MDKQDALLRPTYSNILPRAESLPQERAIVEDPPQRARLLLYEIEF